MCIEDYIPFGKDNAISREQFLRVSGMRNDRTMRNAIENARKRVPIVNMQDGNGYFRPKEDEKKEAEIWLKLQYSRLKRMYDAMEGAKVFVGTMEGQFNFLDRGE